MILVPIAIGIGIWDLKALNLTATMQAGLNKNYAYDLSVLSISPR